MTEQTLTLRGVVYTVKELMMRDVAPLIEGDDAFTAMEIAQLAIFRDGQPIGEAFMDLPFPIANKLLVAATEVNNLAPDDEGNA
jgi:hypothetical protein